MSSTVGRSLAIELPDDPRLLNVSLGTVLVTCGPSGVRLSTAQVAPNEQREAMERVMRDGREVCEDLLARKVGAPK